MMTFKMPDRLFAETPRSYGFGVCESQAASLLIGYPSDDLDFADLTPADWDEVKHQALQIVGMNMLDSPEAHLAYIRGRTMTVGHV